MLELLLSITANAGGAMIGGNILKNFSNGITKNKIGKAAIFIGSICLAEAVGEIAEKQMGKFINDFKKTKKSIYEIIKKNERGQK